MDAWVGNLITVAGVLGATWLANHKSSKDQTAMWEREDFKRWDVNRVEAYATFIGQATSMKSKLDLFDIIGGSSLVGVNDIIADLQAMNFERGQVVLWAGSTELEGAADDLLKAINSYFGDVIGRAAQGVEAENDQASIRKLADHVEVELARFTNLAQKQLGISRRQ